MAALEDAMDILGLFSVTTPGIGQAEIARRLDRPKATVHRALKALTAASLLEYHPQTRLYSPGLRVFELAQLFRAENPFLDILHKKLQRICSLCGHTGYITVFDGPDLMVLQMIRGSSPVSIGTAPGNRVLAHATSNGRAMLALLGDEDWMKRVPDPLPFVSVNAPRTREELRDRIGQVRASGRSYSFSEAYEGIASQGVAMRDPDTLEIYGIAISYPLSSGTDALRAEIAGQLDQLRDDMRTRGGAAMR